MCIYIQPLYFDFFVFILLRFTQPAAAAPQPVTYLPAVQPAVIPGMQPVVMVPGAQVYYPQGTTLFSK